MAGEFTLRDAIGYTAAAVAFGMLQAQVVLNDHRIDRLEITGSPQVIKLQAASETQGKRLDAVSTDVEAALRTNDSVHATTNERVSQLTARLAQSEDTMRGIAKDVVTTVADRISALDKRLAVVETTLNRLDQQRRPSYEDRW